MSCAVAGFHTLTEVRVDAEVMSHGVLPPIVTGVVVRVICPGIIKIKISNLHSKTEQTLVCNKCVGYMYNIFGTYMWGVLHFKISNMCKSQYFFCKWALLRTIYFHANLIQNF